MTLATRSGTYPLPPRRTTFQNSTRDFGVPLRTHRVEPNTAEHAAFWDDPCWTRRAQRRSAEAPVAAESVQPACPTGEGVFARELRSFFEGEEHKRHMASVRRDFARQLST